MVWKAVVHFLNLIINLLEMSGFKRRLAHEQSVHDYSNRPYIHFVRMSYLAFNDFRGDVIRCPAKSTSGLTVFDFCCEAEISYFDFHVFGEEQICQLQVPVNHVFILQILQRGTYLLQIAQNLNLVKFASLFEKLIHTSVLAQLYDYVDIFFVLEK